jgi:arylsulfatase A-like enzyme
VLASVAFLQLAQGVVMALKYGPVGAEASAGMAVLGIWVAPVTLLVLLPVILLLRRRHPAWLEGDRHRASWAVSFGLTAAIVGWMIADQVAANVDVSTIIEPWLEALAALAAGLAASSWVRPSVRWLKAGAVFVPVSLVLSMLLAPRSGPPGSETQDETVQSPLENTGPAPAGSLDVVLVSIDTLRADRLGAYGRSPSLTPEMDRLAGEGITFTRALAASAWTVPSMASVLTGLPVVRHGAGRPMGSGMTFRRSPLANEVTTVAERFAAAGYRTRAVSANGFASAEMGLGQGFEVFENSFNGAMAGGFLGDLPLTRLVMSFIPDEKLGDYRAQAVTDTALGWLAEDDDKPLFLWVHYLGPHTPLRADPNELGLGSLKEMTFESRPEPDEQGSVIGDVFVATSQVRSGMLWLSPEDKQKLEDRYDTAVKYVDEHVGRLFATLRERQTERPVVAALTSDHGEEFWDHGHFEHGHDFYREITWVPLLFWSPQRLPAGRVVDSTVGHVDLGPTLLDLASVPVAPPAAPDEGRTLASLFTETAEEAVVEEGGAGDGDSGKRSPPRFSGGNIYGLPAALVEDGRWRFILRANGQEELYDIELDPAERFNLAGQHRDVAARYRQLLEPRLATLIEETGEAAELSAETVEALRALGYAN